MDWKWCHILPFDCFCMCVGMEDFFKVPDVEKTAEKSSVPKLWDLLRKLMTGCKLSTAPPKYSVSFSFLTVSHDGGISVKTSALELFFNAWEKAIVAKEEVQLYEEAFEVSFFC